jgi:hypothetical protein
LLQLAGGHMFRVGENTKVILKELGKDKSFSFQVLAGNIWSAVRTLNQPTKYEVETPSAVAGVSGTVFAVFHDLATGQTTVSTNKGTVNVQQFNGQGRAGNVAPVGVGQYVQIGSTAPPAPGTQTGSGHNGQNNPVPTAAPVKRIVPLPAPTAFVRMWRTMRLNENWIGPLNGRGPGKLNQNIGPQLRMLKSPSVSAIRGNRSLAAPPVRQVPGKGAHRRTSAAPPVRQGSGNGEEHRKL